MVGGNASSTRLAICADVKDLLLSVTEIVSDTNTACWKQSLDRKSKLQTHQRLARDAFVINSFMAGGEILPEFQAQLPVPAPYSSSNSIQVT